MSAAGRRATATLLALGLLGCGGGLPLTGRVPSDVAVMKRRIEGLKALIAAAHGGPLTRFDETLIVIDERLVDGLLQAAMPFDRILRKKYSVRVDRASVSFDDGFALVILTGRASLADHTDTFADVKVWGGLDILELDRESGVLRGHMKVIAVDVARVDVKGVTAPLRRLVADLSRTKLSDFEELLSRLEIPIRVQSEIEIPGVGPEGGVTIAPLKLPLRASIERARAFGGKLWISVTASTATPSGARP